MKWKSLILGWVIPEMQARKFSEEKKKIFCRPNGNHNIYKDEVMWASGRIFKMQQFFFFMITVTMDLPRLGLCMAAPAKASAPFLG